MTRDSCIQGFKNCDDLWDISRAISTFTGNIGGSADALSKVTSVAVFPQILSKMMDISEDVRQFPLDKGHSVKVLILDGLSLVGNGCDALGVLGKMNLIRAGKFLVAALVISDGITVVVDGVGFFSHIEQVSDNYQKMESSRTSKQKNYYYSKTWAEGMAVVKTVLSVAMAFFALLSFVATSLSVYAFILIPISGLYVGVTVVNIFLNRFVEDKKKHISMVEYA
jgi:hypothetical protein